MIILGKDDITIDAVYDMNLTFKVTAEFTNDEKTEVVYHITPSVEGVVYFGTAFGRKVCVKYNIMVYKNGIMYYTWFIKDQNYIDSSITETDKSYYSVMRNTIYDLTVKSLSRIGTDIPGGWNPNVDPDDPVVNKDVYMVVEAKVNDWVLSTEDIDLE